MGGSVQGQAISLTGVASTLAGSAAIPYQSFGIATDGTNLYVADSSDNTIKKVAIASGSVTILAGTAGTSGSGDGTGGAASFRAPSGIAVDSAKTNLYVSDTGNNTIRKIVIATGNVSTLAGTASVAGHVDRTGTSASFNSPYGITTDGAYLYVTDTGNNIIRMIR